MNKKFILLLFVIFAVFLLVSTSAKRAEDDDDDDYEDEEDDRRSRRPSKTTKDGEDKEPEEKKEGEPGTTEEKATTKQEESTEKKPSKPKAAKKAADDEEDDEEDDDEEDDEEDDKKGKGDKENEKEKEEKKPPVKLFENTTNVRPVRDLDHMLEIKAVRNDHAECIFYHIPRCKKCEEMANTIQNFTDSVDGVLLVHQVSCRDLWVNHKERRSEISLCDPENEDRFPSFICYEPPVRRINPYTGKPMIPNEHTYNGGQVLFSMEEWALKFAPSWRQKLYSKRDLKEFLKFTKIPNKVLLFTNRPETPEMFKGLSATFRDRLDFGEVQSNIKELTIEYNIENFPTLLVLKLNSEGNYDPEVYDGEVNFDDVKAYLDTLALPNKIDRDDSNKEKEKKAKKDEDTTVDDNVPDVRIRLFDKQILGNEKMVLIHVYNEEEAPSFKIIRKKFGTIIDYYNLRTATQDVENFARNKLGIKNIPSFRLYPVGTEKKNKMKVFFPPDVKFDDFKKEVSDLVPDRSTALSDKEFQIFVTTTLQEDKIPVVLFHNQAEATISYRALSNLKKFEERLKFFTFRDPGPEIMKQFSLTKLPKLITLMRNPTADEAARKEGKDIQVGTYTGKIFYDDLLRFLESITQQEDYAPTRKRRPKQVTTLDEFEEQCSKRASVCFIAFLDGSNQEDDRFNYHMEILEKLWEKYPGRAVSLVWIDGYCHSYLLQKVELGEDYMPQLMAYIPSKKSFVNQIGTFDVDSLTIFTQKVTQGKVGPRAFPGDFDIEEKNCVEIHEKRALDQIKQKEEKAKKAAEDAELEQEILREILEEEKKKKEQIEKELKSAKKKKGKKRKNEDL